jgi:hypothetical protein
MLVLTCHEHVARIFHEAGGYVRTFTDAAPVWDRPQPAIAGPRPVRTPRPAPEPRPTPEPRPAVVEPTPAPAPVAVTPPIAKPAIAIDTGDMWPAEAFFFGPRS